MTVLTQTVREIALENPASIRVFESFGIDYCCGGRVPLQDACATKNLSLEDVLSALERAGLEPSSEEESWTTAPLAALTAHIVQRHHAYVSRELPRLGALAVKVVNRHGDTRPELPAIQARLSELSEELTQHCAKEERILFPYIAQLEGAIAAGAARPHGCFGSVSNPIALMIQEHVGAGRLVAEIRELSNGFTPPRGACPTFLAFYSGLHEFDQDLHQHIHLENNILFPRAVRMEESAA